MHYFNGTISGQCHTQKVWAKLLVLGQEFLKEGENSKQQKEIRQENLMVDKNLEPKKSRKNGTECEEAI